MWKIHVENDDFHHWNMMMNQWVPEVYLQHGHQKMWKMMINRLSSGFRDSRSG
jgi:hypothetical protein